VSGSTVPPRTVYQTGRALAAKGDVNGAVHDFELALSQGYAAAGIDLARQLTRENVHSLDPARAVSLYEQAWRRGLSIAAFDLGQLYERGLPAPVTTGGRTFPTDPTKAWLWYRRGADAREPNALARFASREAQRAASESPGQVREDLLLEAFRLYAQAAARAQEQGWPEEVWRTWRYHRASFARVLARDGLMQEVADAYAAVLNVRESR
jgi:TPR repeat protein